MFSTLISPKQANALPTTARLFFDCRHDLFAPDAGREAYVVGHLPGAHFLHLDEDLSGEIIPGQTGRHPLPQLQPFTALMGRFGLRAGTQVVCYDDKGGGIAARLWWMLRALGHDAVAVLDGGIQAWAAEGLPLEAGPDRVVPSLTGTATHLAPSSVPRTRDRAQVDQLRQDPAHRLIDSRTAPRYAGEDEPIDPVAGHIPGAINLPWPDNLTDGKFKDRDQLKIRFAELVDKADHNVFYCGSGVTACHNVLAYHHAFGEMPGLYPGSWSEWIVK